MLKTLLVLVFFVSITGCSNPYNEIGIPNPASQYCIKIGGELEIRNEDNGQVGYCHLQNGNVVEEWAFYRLQNKM